MKADKERLVKAAEMIGMPYFGCDTPEHLADEILVNRATIAALKSQESPALVLMNRTVEILHMNATWSNSAAELADEIADFLNGKLIQESPADAWARGIMAARQQHK